MLISTDKAVSPTSIMGATKRVACMIVRQAARQAGRAFVVVRFGNVLGSRGSVVPLFKRQIELGRPITVTHPDMQRFFMTIPEAVHLVLEAGGMGLGGELFVLNMGEPVRIVDLARDLIRLSGAAGDQAPIEFVGLRPGERLRESICEEGATIEPTAVPRILRVCESEPLVDEALPAALVALRRADSRDAIEQALRMLLPAGLPTRLPGVSGLENRPRRPRSMRVPDGHDHACGGTARWQAPGRAPALR